MTTDRDVLMFILGLPFGAMVVALFILAPEVRRIAVVGSVVLFVVLSWLVGMERVVASLANALERWIALRFFAAAMVAGALITLAAWPRPSRSGKGGPTS